MLIFYSSLLKKYIFNQTFLNRVLSILPKDVDPKLLNRNNTWLRWIWKVNFSFKRKENEISGLAHGEDIKHDRHVTLFY